jgi:hypothetical protein
MRHQEGRHPRLVQSDAHAVTRHAGLGYFEERGANPVAIAYAHLIVGQAFHCKILAELPERKITAPEVMLPIAIGIQLVDQYRAVLSSMPRKIPLSVAIHV